MWSQKTWWRQRKRRVLSLHYKPPLHYPQVRWRQDPVTGSLRMISGPTRIFLRVTANLGLEIEELKESAHSLIHIMVAAVPSRVALPINEVVMWQ